MMRRGAHDRNLETLLAKAEHAIATWDMSALEEVTQQLHAMERIPPIVDVNKVRARLRALGTACSLGMGIVGDVLDEIVEHDSPKAYSSSGQRTKSGSRARVCREYG